MWLDLELSGTRPEPLVRPAMATIDQNRALLLGVNMNEKFHSFVMNLNSKVNFLLILYNDDGNSQLVRPGRSLISI